MRCASAHVRLRCIGNRCSPYGHCCDTERPKNAATERPTPHVQCFVQRSVSAFRELARRQEPRTMRCGQRTTTTVTGHAHSRRRPVKDPLPGFGTCPATPGVERAAKLDLDCPMTTTLAAAPLGMRRLHKVGRAIRRLFGKVIDHDAANGLGHRLPHPGVHFDALTTRSAER